MIETKSTVFARYASPLGQMTIQANHKGLLGAWFKTQTTQPANLGQLVDDHPLLNLTTSQLDEYFAGKRHAFSIPLAANGTPFQLKVWQALTTIPFATTWSYQDLASAIGNPKAVRAVGLANGKNPISIIVPCHRVIGKNGSLTGYAGGIETKAWLLNLEASQALNCV